MSRKIRSYSKLIEFHSFEDRFKYLSIGGQVGTASFGYDRHLNQKFYRSREWKQIRDAVIVRDMGCDLGVEGHEIYDRLLVHHMNPMTIDDVLEGREATLDPEFLIVTQHITHNAIHYGDERLLPKPVIERRPGDTRLW